MKTDLLSVLEVALVAGALAFAGCSDDAGTDADDDMPSTGSSSSSGEAGCPAADAGCPAADAGCPAADAGCPAQDAN